MKKIVPYYNVVSNKDKNDFCTEQRNVMSTY